jgi:predicted lipoprotein with Yx(FWY)xxD motif
VAVALATAALVALAAAGFASAHGTTGGTQVDLRKTKLGTILVDAHGRTLYLFMKDKKNKSECSGACAAGWPPLMATGKPKAGKGAEAKLLGTTARNHGTQVTYNGHPLYRYVGDTKAGQTNGEGSKAFGAEWYVVAPNGNKIDKS